MNILINPLILKWKSFIKTVFLLIVTLPFLPSCSSNMLPERQITTQGIIIGSVLGGIVGGIFKKKKKKEDQAKAVATGVVVGGIIGYLIANAQNEALRNHQLKNDQMNKLLENMRVYNSEIVAYNNRLKADIAQLWHAQQNGANQVNFIGQELNRAQHKKRQIVSYVAKLTRTVEALREPTQQAQLREKRNALANENNRLDLLLVELRNLYNNSVRVGA